MIDAIVSYYTAENANIHRGVHTLSERGHRELRASSRHGGAISRTAADAREIIFVRGATEGINLVAQTWGRANVGGGDEIVVSAMEHHSNIVPWQILCQEKERDLRVAR